MVQGALKLIIGLVILLSVLSAVGLGFLRTYQYTPSLKITGQQNEFAGKGSRP
jgi:hypothetical protein